MAPRKARAEPARVVLVLQGGGALGAYQWGVYEALHDAGLEPAWVVGTSIGAINAALIAANAPAQRVQRLREFWARMEQHSGDVDALGLGRVLVNAATVARGIAGFFEPNPAAWWGPLAPVGVEQAGCYRTQPLRRTLAELLDFGQLQPVDTRLTVGAVNACSGAMRYFDSREEPLHLDHVMASAALPPAFPAVLVEGQPYWDGGLYSNTPIEAVLDDNPRRDALIFAVNVWHPSGPEPQSLWQVMGRQKDIQYASRADSHLARQRQIHRLRHVIRALASELPAERRAQAEVQALTAWGCGTTMHVVHLAAPRLRDEDHTKDIDFTRAGVQARFAAGCADTRAMIERAPWRLPVGPLEAVVEHRLPAG